MLDNRAIAQLNENHIPEPNSGWVKKGRSRGQHRNQTHCKNGHELLGENVRIEVTGFRRCVPCRKEYEKQWKQNRRNK